MGINVDKWKEMVKGPGKFEGEQPETAYFYDAMMNGDGESVDRYPDDCEEYADEPIFAGDRFMVDADESEAFDLPIGSYVILWTDSQGFTMLSRAFETIDESEKWVDEYCGIEVAK